LWAKNLTNDDEPDFENGIATPPMAVSSSFVPARTFGVDLTYDY
jgi:hypothetical protein